MKKLAFPPYHPPFLFRNRHVNTIYATLFRRVQAVAYERERITTEDGDFLDLDWSTNGSHRLAIISHGLEGSADRPYVYGMAQAFHRRGWDVLAWNYRGCSGEPNLLLKSYHSGATEDLETVTRHALGTRAYETIVLVGFSLGGNLTLKYLGERGDDVADRIGAAVAISVPIDLASCAEQLDKPQAWIYRKWFMRRLLVKAQAKQEQFPDGLEATPFDEIRHMRAFDEHFTAPVHGFRDAADYYEQSSSRPFIPDIRIPTLLINAKDDPFLAPSSYPYEEAAKNPDFHLLAPDHGGHVGFVTFDEDGEFWSEACATRFADVCADIVRT